MTPFQLATTNKLNEAQVAVNEVNSTSIKKELQEELDAATQEIEKAKSEGKLLQLSRDKKAGQNTYLSVLVKEGTNQKNATATELQQALKQRYNDIKDNTLTEGYDNEGIKALNEANVKFNFDAIQISDSGEWISVDENFMTIEAFKVAKGKGIYNGDYNITILTDNAEATPGNNNSQKAAKIVVSSDGNKITNVKLQEI